MPFGAGRNPNTKTARMQPQSRSPRKGFAPANLPRLHTPHPIHSAHRSPLTHPTMPTTRPPSGTPLTIPPRGSSMNSGRSMRSGPSWKESARLQGGVGERAGRQAGRCGCRSQKRVEGVNAVEVGQAGQQVLSNQGKAGQFSTNRRSSEQGRAGSAVESRWLYRATAHGRADGCRQQGMVPPQLCSTIVPTLTSSSTHSPSPPCPTWQPLPREPVAPLNSHT